MARPKGTLRSRSWKESDRIRALVRESADILRVSVADLAELPITLRGKGERLRRIQNLLSGARPLTKDGALDLLDIVSAMNAGVRSSNWRALSARAIEGDHFRKRIVGPTSTAALLVPRGEGRVAADALIERLRGRLPNLRGTTLRAIGEQVTAYFSDYERHSEYPALREALANLRWLHNDRHLNILRASGPAGEAGLVRDGSFRHLEEWAARHVRHIN